eukprot:6327053-Amphidinium_carterae.1
MFSLLAQTAQMAAQSSGMHILKGPSGQGAASYRQHGQDQSQQRTGSLHRSQGGQGEVVRGAPRRLPRTQALAPMAESPLSLSKR